MTPIGADTETCHGAVKTLCLSDGSHIEASDTESLLAFLWGHVPEGDRIVIWWNLGYDLSSILKSHLEAQGDVLRATYRAWVRKAMRLEYLRMKDALAAEEQQEAYDLYRELSSGSVLEKFEVGPWRVKVMGDKAWTLRRQGSREKAVWSFDASKFYASGFGGISLERAAQQYLHEGKTDRSEGISRRRIGEEQGYFEHKQESIIRYCVHDARLTLRLFEHTKDGYERLGMAFPVHPFSKGSVAKQYLRDHQVLTGTRKGLEWIERSPYSVFWRQSFSGGVFLLRRAGLTEHPEIWDINSAYPAAMVDLPSLEGASLVPWGAPGFDACAYKFYRVYCPPTPRTPTRDLAGGRKIYGWQEEGRVFFLAAPDVEAMDRCGDPYTILDGVGVFCPSPERPFAFLREMYGRKTDIKREFGGDSVEYLNLKLAINSFYGVMAQSRPFETRDTNFIMASYITSICRRELWYKSVELESKGAIVISYATDGLVVSWPPGPRIPVVSTTALGEWSVTEAEQIVYFESGIYCTLRDDQWTVHCRGMPGLSAVELQIADGSWLDHEHEAPTRYKAAVIQGEPERVNLFEPQVRRLSPLASYEEGAMTFPREMTRAVLGDYFLQSWPLWLRGEPHEGEDGIVVDGKKWRARERAERRAWDRGRPRRGPLSPLTLRSQIALGA